MFNASWLAPNSVTEKISINNKRNQLLDNYSILPEIQKRNEYLTNRQPKLNVMYNPKKQFSGSEEREIFYHDQRNWFLLNQLKFPNNSDIEYHNQQLQKSIEMQEQINKLIKLQLVTQSRQNSLDVRLNKVEQKEKKRSESYIQTGQEIINKNEKPQVKKIRKQTKSTEKYEISEDYSYSYRKSQSRNRMRLSLQSKKYGLRKYVYLVYFVQCLSKNYRILKKKKNLLQQLNTQRISECQQILEKYSIRVQAQMEKQYFLLVLEKVIYYLKDEKFYLECLKMKNMSEKMTKDIHSTHIYKFTTLLFDNIALYTQKNTISPVVYSIMNMNIHEDSRMPCSKYIAYRCHFINSERPKIPKEQLLLIGLEYYMFHSLIPTLLDAINDFSKEKKIKFNYLHLSECFYYVFVFAAIIQKKVILLNFKKVKNPNGNIINRVLDITQQNNQIIKAVLGIDDVENEEDNQFIIAGLNTNDLIEQLEKQRIKWRVYVDTKFQEIQMNIVNLLKI